MAQHIITLIFGQYRKTEICVESSKTFTLFEYTFCWGELKLIFAFHWYRLHSQTAAVSSLTTHPELESCPQSSSTTHYLRRLLKAFPQWWFWMFLVKQARNYRSKPLRNHVSFGKTLRFQKKIIRTEWTFFLNLFWNHKIYICIENNDYPLVMAWWADQGPVSKLCSRTHY